MSIQKVAGIAGVSTSTVSRVLNKEPNVSPQACEKVLAAIKQSGYARPESGRKGRPRKDPSGLVTGNIAVVFPYEKLRSETPVTARLIHGLTQASDSQGLNLMLSQFSPKGRPPALLKRVRVDGVIVRPGVFGDEVSNNLKIDAPTVWLFEQGQGVLPENVDNVMPDNERAGQIAAKYFKEKGRKRVAVVNPFGSHVGCRTRTRAFVEACINLGLDVAEVSKEVTIDELVKLFQNISPEPAGLFIPAWLPGLYHALREAGAEPCDKMDLVFCQEDKKEVDMIDGRIVCIDVRFEEIATLAIETLLWRLKNPEKPKRRILVAPAILL